MNFTFGMAGSGSVIAGGGTGVATFQVEER